jgi:hypothetical protein
MSDNALWKSLCYSGGEDNQINPQSKLAGIIWQAIYRIKFNLLKINRLFR